jgi:hypothetical protein
VHFIKRSAARFVDQWNQQVQLRRRLFDSEKTPKRVFSFWFFVFALGQIGIITSLIWAGISGDGLIDALAKQGKSGNFLTFEISLILSCLVYYFEEYGEEPVRELFFLRITLLILGMIIAFLAMLNYIFINSAQSPHCWSLIFVMYNTFLYVSGVLLSYLMYITFSVVEKSAAGDLKDKTATAIDTAQNLPVTDVGNIGNKSINITG